MLVLGAAGLLRGEEVAVSSEHREDFSAGLQGTRCIESSGVVRSPTGKLLSAAGSSAAMDLGLALVERCLGVRLAGNLRNSVLPQPTTRLELSDQKLELPPRR